MGGCGFVFPSHLPVMQAGHLTNTPYAYSVVVYGMLFISCYGTQCSRDTFSMLHDTLCKAAASGMPYVTVGDFNIRNAAMRHWLFEQGICVQVLDFGVACTQQGGPSDIDFAILSPCASHHISRHFKQQTTLNTHQAIHVEFVSPGLEQDFAYTAWDRPKPPKTALLFQ
jgi:hypothetical protein